MKTFTLVRDFGSHALDLGLERKKTVLAVIGGVALLAVAGVIVSRVLRARATARTEADTDVELPDARPSIKTNVGRGAGANGMTAKA